MVLKQESMRRKRLIIFLFKIIRIFGILYDNRTGVRGEGNIPCPNSLSITRTKKKITFRVRRT